MRTRVCAEPGCPTLSTATRCTQHQRAKARTNRAEHTRNDYGPGWPSVRYRQLRAHPRCEHCGKKATVVDHRTPRRYFTSSPAANHPSNLCSLCKPCHDRKTVKLDGGFGRAPDPAWTPGPTPQG